MAWQVPVFTECFRYKNCKNMHHLLPVDIAAIPPFIRSEKSLPAYRCHSFPCFYALLVNNFIRTERMRGRQICGVLMYR